MSAGGHRSWTFFFVVPTLLICVSCLNYRHHPFLALPAPVPAPRETGRIFNYDKAPLDVRNSDLANEDSEHYQVKHLAFTSYGRNGQQDDQIDVLWFLGKKEGPKPTVIILPIWGSYTYPSNRISAGIRKLGTSAVNVLQVTGKSRVLDWTEMGAAATEDEFIERIGHNLERIRTNVVDISRLTDWAVSSKEVDPDRLGLVGFSHSAVVAALAAINDGRLQAAVIVMGGAHPYRTFATCAGRVGELRDIVTNRFGWTVDEYQSRIEPLTRDIDVASYPGIADPAHVLMIDAKNDECFPLDAREDLWLALGRPERITLAYSHKRSFLAMTPLGFNWLRQPVYDFLDQRLQISEP